MPDHITYDILTVPDLDDFVLGGFVHQVDRSLLKDVLLAGETANAHFQKKFAQLIENRMSQNSSKLPAEIQEKVIIVSSSLSLSLTHY